ncbi:MAG: THUMP domain-containing protein, partial [Nitrososphaerales archaeon]
MRDYKVLVSLSECIDTSSKRLLARQISTSLKLSGLHFFNKEIRRNIILIDSNDPVHAAEAISKIPGVDFTAIVRTTSSKYDDVVESIVETGTDLIYPNETFDVRADIKGSLPYLSRDIEFATCARIIGELGDKNVRQNRKNPSKIIYANIEDEMACVFYYKYDGPGGRPVGSQGKAVCPLFGDNESAVASWLMIKQGIFPYFLFFDFRPYSDNFHEKRVITIATLLREFLPIKRYNITALRMGIVIERLGQFCPSKILQFLINRITLRTTCAYARRIGINTIVGGENLEKNSLENIKDSLRISSNYKVQILFPLIGLSKKE